jgi:hypothetical protein
MMFLVLSRIGLLVLQSVHLRQSLRELQRMEPQVRRPLHLPCSNISLSSLGALWHGQGSPSSMPGPMEMQLPTIVLYQ